MIDLTASSPEYLIVQETLEIAGDSSDRYVSMPDQIFYDRDFQLWKVGANSTQTKMTLGTDYRFIFKIPVFRSQDTVHAAYAAIEIITAASGDQYAATYRAVGAAVIVNKQELVQFHQANPETEKVNFLGLLTPNGLLPDALRLGNASLTLKPVLISYSSLIGAAEKAAHELNFSEIEIVQPSETTVVDASSSQKGIIKLAGDLEGTADLPRVKGLVDKLDATQAASMFLTQPNADLRYASMEQGQKADAALPVSEVSNVIQLVGDGRYVRSVNGQTPNQQGDVVLTGGGSIDGGIF